MCDIFLTQDLRALFNKKKVVFMGDSNVRALYKDVLCLYTKSEMISARVLKEKMESSVFNDKLMFHKEKTNGRGYREERQLITKKHDFSFYFITRVYNEYTEEVLTKMMQDKEPDVVVINSCIWDMCRWGPKGVEEYKKNLIALMKKLNQTLSKNCLVIWLTAPPLSGEAQGGFLVVQLEFLKYCLRFHVMEANHYSRKVVVAHGYDVLDVHYHLRMQVQRRAHDGIHWTFEAMRYITNLLLTHVSLAWGVALPHRFESVVTSRAAVEENDDEAFALESEADTPVKPTKQKITFGEGSATKRKKSTHHAYVKKARVNLAKRNIRSWSPIPRREAPNRPFLYPNQPNYTPFTSFQPQNNKPFQFSAPTRRVRVSRHADMYNAPASRNNFYFNDPDLPRNCRF